MRKNIVAAIIVPVITLASLPGSASELCDRLEARLNQMPEIIGSGASARVKSESLYRINLRERAIRRDQSRLQCPTDSFIVWNDQQAEACDRLGEELSVLLKRKRAYGDLEPVLRQHVDDGSGTLAAILADIRKAGCTDPEARAEVQAINGEGSMLDQSLEVDKAAYSTGSEIRIDELAIYPHNDDDAGGDENTAVNGSEQSADQSMTKIDPGPLRGERSVISVRLPKLKNGDATVAPDVAMSAPAERTVDTPAVPLRDYDPNDKTVRRVGPAFLADDEGLDLRHPADPEASN